MKFPRLNASITNNASEEPSIYMALCAFESMLGDIEDESGNRIEALNAGSDMLSTKLVWLCRVIKKIYQNNSDTLGSSSKLLPKAMDDIKAIEGSLAEYAATEAKLSEAKKQNAALTAKLKAAQGKNQELLKIQQENKELEQRINQWNNVDSSAEKEKLRALKEEAQKGESERQKLAAQIDSAKIEVAAQEAEREKTDAKLRGLNEKRDEIISEIAAKKDECAALEAARDAKDKERIRIAGCCDNAEKQKSELDNKIKSLTDRLSELQDQVAELQTEKLPELEQQVDAEQSRLKDSVCERDRLQQDAKNTQTEIEKTKADIDVLTQSQEQNQISLKELTAKRDKIREANDQLDHQLKLIQDTLPSDWEKKLKLLEERLQFIMSAHTELNNQLDQVKRITGGLPLDAEAEAGYKNTDEAIRELSAAAEKLAKRLVACADAVQFDHIL